MKAIALFTLLLVFFVTAGYSQKDSTRYINGLPVTAADSASAIPPSDRPPYNKLIPVPMDMLPHQVRASLEKESQYAGWRDTTVYRDKNTGIYLVPVRRIDGIRIFGLNANGEPVSFSEVSRHDDR